MIQKKSLFLNGISTKSKRKVALILTLIMVCSSIAGCTQKKEVVDEDLSFDEFCDDLMKEYVESDSITAHFTVTDPTDYGVTFEEEDYTLGDFTDYYMTESTDDVTTYLNQLELYDKKNLTEEQQLTYDILKEYFETQEDYVGVEYLENAMGPSSGLISNLSTNFVEYQFYDVEDVEHYFLYLKDTERFMNQVFDFMREQSEQGYFMSDEIGAQVIEFCEGYLDAETDPVSASFEDKINAMNLTDDEKQAYIDKNYEYVDKYYKPVYQETIDLLKELKGTGKNEGGLSNYGKKGIQLYEAILRDKTSSDLTPEEVIELLDDEMSDIMKTILAISTADPDALTYFESYEPDFTEPDQVLEYVLDNMSEDFPDPVTTNYTIEYQNKAAEIEGNLAYYVTSRIDDIEVNNIKVNQTEVASDAMTMYKTLAHEGYPGHLYQFTSFFADGQVPAIRKVLNFIGATEGWAEYASTLTLNYLGLDDNVVQLIDANDMFSYVLCSRVDLGVNYESWTLEDTEDYLDDYIGDDSETAESIYYSVIGDPGLYLPYTTGHIMMDELKEEAQDQLGDAFNLKEYHQWILDVGIAPFTVYESELDKWIESK